MMAQKLSQQAVFLPKADSFQRWVEHKAGVVHGCYDEATVSAWLRAQIGYESRSELDHDLFLANRFTVLLSEYRQYLAKRESEQF